MADPTALVPCNHRCCPAVSHDRADAHSSPPAECSMCVRMVETVGADPALLDTPVFDCGHRCCTERHNPHHDHFLGPDDCPSCRAVARREEMTPTQGRKLAHAWAAARLQTALDRGDIETAPHDWSAPAVTRAMHDIVHEHDHLSKQ